jgi:hypothetical protein
MIVLPKPEDSGKWETLRRLRYGQMKKLFRHRYGYELPNDSDGRAAIIELCMNVSLARSASNRVENAIEIWAPWMQPDEASSLVSHLNRLDLFERTPTAAELGKRLKVSNDERERLKLWQIAPIDMTPEGLAEQRKARERERRARKRRAKGSRTKEQYLADLAARPKPWLAAGCHRRTWERRRRKMSPNTSARLPQCKSEINSSKERTQVAALVQAERQKGFQERGGLEDLREPEEVRQVERDEQPSSPRLRTRTAAPRDDLARVAALMKERATQEWMKKIQAPSIEKGASRNEGH